MKQETRTVHKQKSLLICTLAIIIAFLPGMGRAGAQETISLTIPESVIAKSLKDILPLDFQMKSGFGGNVHCTSIENVKLSQDRLKFEMDAEIQDFSYTIELMGKSVLIDVGSADIDLACDVKLTFRDGIFYITPVFSSRAGSSKDPNVETILPLLQELLGNREYAIDSGDIETVDSRIGGTIFNLGMKITEVKIGDKKLILRGYPEIKRLKEVSGVEKNN